jgi:hypothetical protein
VAKSIPSGARCDNNSGQSRPATSAWLVASSTSAAWPVPSVQTPSGSALKPNPPLTACRVRAQSIERCQVPAASGMAINGHSDASSAEGPPFSVRPSSRVPIAKRPSRDCHILDEVPRRSAPVFQRGSLLYLASQRNAA